MQNQLVPAQQSQTHQRRRRSNAIPICHPETGRDITPDIFLETQSQSADSSSSATPLSNQVCCFRLAYIFQK